MQVESPYLALAPTIKAIEYTCYCHNRASSGPPGFELSPDRWDLQEYYINEVITYARQALIEIAALHELDLLNVIN